LKEIRIHGRGGQGAVLAAELLAVAALEDGKFGQAFPAFGGERRGAPVQAFVRLSNTAIRLRHRVNQPDYVLILDSSLLETVDVLRGFKPGGLVLINSEKAPSSLAWTADAQVCAVPATRIALEVFGQPFINPAMLGAFAAVTNEISLAAIQQAFRHRFPGTVGEKNSRAAQLGYEWLQSTAIAPRPVVRSRESVTTPIGWDGDPGLGAPGRPLNPAIVIAPRTSLAYPTGTWRYHKPIVDLATCNGCGVCAMLCPDGCILINGKQAIIDYEYCKGCGICAAECTPEAIQLIAEED
jgi:pyruvate ferredoxin oxidoreductase gamma subunit